ncbi:hypothetical protein K458DRAFT_430498 [Lentithecium fluviatile CBS 122367]|uniref:Uncharacterized protein n=1 Tax=Lentithecium fluviatile CBS 122367 TaxID=1168545 RepID=A0A6G1J6C1_9PLEO|nr:hypothetical protein K458DRAFT_430498 [Lentithecium fluviatile CBS 122367]
MRSCVSTMLDDKINTTLITEVWLSELLLLLHLASALALPLAGTQAQRLALQGGFEDVTSGCQVGLGH